VHVKHVDMSAAEVIISGYLVITVAYIKTQRPGYCGYTIDRVKDNRAARNEDAGVDRECTAVDTAVPCTPTASDAGFFCTIPPTFIVIFIVFMAIVSATYSTFNLQCRCIEIYARAGQTSAQKKSILHHAIDAPPIINIIMPACFIGSAAYINITCAFRLTFTSAVVFTFTFISKPLNSLVHVRGQSICSSSHNSATVKHFTVSCQNRLFASHGLCQHGGLYCRIPTKQGPHG
jgi:hypothetical protein